MKYLVAAEADKIQDFIFRAARLREVVGGSQLLARFCGVEGAVTLADHYGGGKIISDGGAFLFEFVDKENANDFGRDLAELYRRCAGGNLTVADPIGFEADEFKEKSKEAKENLRLNKSAGDVSASAVHLPYTAFCASCGLAVALDHRSKVKGARANYICSNCFNKDREQAEQKKVFINDFRKAVLQITDDQAAEKSLAEPEKNDWTDAIGRLDARNYVAYLVADSNGMGRLFSDCDKEQMMLLSDGLTKVLRESLASPCRELLKGQPDLAHESLLPIVPLILGGDDLFALLPAPWALDLMRRFCIEYEKGMKTLLGQDEFAGVYEENRPATISATVVICKSSYPHTLAYNRARIELKKAKELARRIEVAKQPLQSVVSFSFIAGHRIDDLADLQKQLYRSTRQPYFIREVDKNLGTDVLRLSDLRLSLKDLPAKRRAELKDLYDNPPKHEDDLDMRWTAELKTLLERIGRKEKDANSLKKALKELGNPAAEKGHWTMVDRFGEDWFGQGLPDLLAIWNYAYKVDQPKSVYDGD